MKEKKKLLCSLISFLIIFSSGIPVSSMVVRASEATEIWDWHDLHAIRDNLGGHYVLMNNLDAAVAGYAEMAGPMADDGKGWQPIGSSLWTFVGSFRGQEYEIRDLFIDRPDESRVGLFGEVRWPGVIADVSLVGASVGGEYGVGGLVGENWGTVSNSYAGGSVTGERSVGGLVGYNVGTVSNSYAGGSVIGGSRVGSLVGQNYGTVSNSYAGGSVTGERSVGGLVGYNADTVSNSYAGGNVAGIWEIGGLVGQNEGFVSNCGATGSVIAEGYVGGLMGWNVQGHVSNCYATGSVEGELSVGGLVGYNTDTVSDSYATGSVSGYENVGGLVGYSSGAVNRCYSTGDVTGDYYVGGLIGYSWGTVSDSYSTGSVTGDDIIGGLVGDNQGTVHNCFWDTVSSGMKVSGGGTGKTTAEMQSIATFTDTDTEGLDEPWDITAVAPGQTDEAYTWNIVDKQTYPFLSRVRPREAPVQYSLTISSTAGGLVTIPGEGTFICDAGTVVNLVASPASGYYLVHWTGDVDTIGNVNAVATTITMHDNYAISAKFEEVPPAPVNWPLIGGIIAAVAVAGVVIFLVRRRRID